MSCHYLIDTLISRILKSYELAEKDYRSAIGEAADFWNKDLIANVRADAEFILKNVKNENVAGWLLSNPLFHNLWYGFDDICKKLRPEQVTVNAPYIYDQLLRFAEALGYRNHNFETGRPLTIVSVNTLLQFIDSALGTTLDFPAPYRGMQGITTNKGIIRERALYSLYLAWRASTFNAKKILEIGGGLGYAAYYSSLLKAADYTIVDIPLTLVASSHFLGLTAGEKNVIMYGEEDKYNTTGQNTCFHLRPPNDFDDTMQYDAVINMDSFVEFGREIAASYVEKISHITKVFISINHEAAPYTVRELLFSSPLLVKYSRYPSWLRRGYVEEIFTFR